MREFLKGLELEKETIDTIMAEHGKLITGAKEETQELKDKVTLYETKVAELEKDSNNSEELKQQLADLQKQIADDEAKNKSIKDDEILTNNIKGIFGDKKFINDYTQNAILSDIKNALKDVNNQGKSAKDLFEELTNDKDGIFVNPNAPKDMPNVNTKINTQVTKEDFAKMPYRDRINLKKESPEVFESLSVQD